MEATAMFIYPLALISTPSLRGALATKQSSFLYAAPWIASRSLSSGAHSRDPLARNDEERITYARPRRAHHKTSDGGRSSIPPARTSYPSPRDRKRGTPFTAPHPSAPPLPAGRA